MSIRCSPNIFTRIRVRKGIRLDRQRHGLSDRQANPIYKYFLTMLEGVNKYKELKDR